MNKEPKYRIIKRTDGWYYIEKLISKNSIWGNKREDIWILVSPAGNRASSLLYAGRYTSKEQALMKIAIFKKGNIVVYDETQEKETN